MKKQSQFNCTIFFHLAKGFSIDNTAVNGKEEVKVVQEDVDDDPISSLRALFETIEISGGKTSSAAPSTTAKSFANRLTTSPVQYFGGARPKELRQNRRVAETQQLTTPPPIGTGIADFDDVDKLDGNPEFILVIVCLICLLLIDRFIHFY